MTRIYFDTEFTGLHKQTTLISIGLVDEAGRQFYAELTDYDQTQVDSWLQANVIDKLYLREAPLLPLRSGNGYGFRVEDKLLMIGDSDQVRIELLNWLSAYDKVEFVSDVCHYDFVLLIDLLYGHALKMPSHVSAVCHDLNQDLALFFNVDSIKAFDMNREEVLLKAFNVDLGISLVHNALHDAKVIRELYMALHDIESDLTD